MDLINNLRKRAVKANRIFTDYGHQTNARLLHQYPRDCCEIATIHWGVILQEEFLDFQIQIARAYNRDTDGWHYWVELESIVLDLTAHQFEQYDLPLVVKTPNPLEKQFPDVEHIGLDKAVEDAGFSINPQLLNLLR